MEIIKYPGREEWSSLIKRPALDVTTLFDTVRTVLDEVREQGDTAVKAYEEKFDKVLLSSLQVSEEEIIAAARTLQQKGARNVLVSTLPTISPSSWLLGLMRKGR